MRSARLAQAAYGGLSGMLSTGARHDVLGVMSSPDDKIDELPAHEEAG